MGTSIAEFNAPFQGAINGLLAACPGLTIGSGYRTYEEQARLYAQKPHLAAPPGKSNHGRPEVGAVDLEGDLDCAHAKAAQFGLHFPMDHEPWHVELLNPGEAIDPNQAYTDPVEQRMVDLETVLFGEGNHLNSPIFTMDAEEANAAYQEGKPGEVLADQLPPGVDMASFAAQRGMAGTMEQATGAAPYVADVDGQQAALAGGAGSPTASVSPSSSSGGPTGPGAATGSGALQPVQAASYLAAAGFRGEALVTAVAIAMGESGLRPNAHGDTSIAGGGWGHSIGLMQIRSRTGENGSGAPRDPSRLEDPLFNARSAYEISSGGNNFGPWTVFTKGIYRQHMDTARQAVASLGNLSTPGAGQIQSSGGNQRLNLGTPGGLVRRYIPLGGGRRPKPVADRRGAAQELRGLSQRPRNSGGPRSTGPIPKNGRAA